MRKRAKPPAPPVVDSEGKRHFGMKADAGFYARFKVPPAINSVPRNSDAPPLSSTKFAPY